MQGRWLLLARAAWLAVALLAVGVFVASVPSYFTELQTVCTGPHAECVDNQLRPERVHGLRELGLSLGFYAGYSTALQVVFGVAYCTVGALIFWRRSEDRGAMLTSFWLVAFGTTFAGMTSVLERSYPALDIFYNVVGNLAFLSFFLLFYLFPDGRFVPPWTRWVAIFFVAYFVLDELYPNFPYNPDNWSPMLGVPFFLGLTGSMVYAQVYRYRNVSGPAQRQQTKWVVFGFVAAILTFIGSGLDDVFQLFPRTGAAGMLSELIYESVGSLAFLLISLSIGVAVLRYRLYEIDLLINRTLVYGSLTAALALVYFGGVATTQAIFRALTGQEQQPQLAVVISTLVIAALFNPLRRRIQFFIDRRFYRSKYDARKTLEAFSAKLRDETDLDALSDDLVGVVRETMQPAHVSLWLRPDTASKKDEASD
jgi:hypothetical protein